MKTRDIAFLGCSVTLFRIGYVLGISVAFIAFMWMIFELTGKIP